MLINSKLLKGLLIFAFSPGLALAGWFGASFSAETVQTDPDGSTIVGEMHVGDGRVRTEMRVDGQQQVRIVNPRAGRIWILLPRQQIYFTRPIPPGTQEMLGGTEKDSPCVGTELACQRQASESINGRQAVRWTVEAEPPDEGVQGEVWTDAVHGFPVMERFEGQIVSEMRFLERETVSGRDTEKWQRRMTGPDGQRVEVFQWYDPELNIAIRQVAPGGYIRELRNIRLVDPPEALFRIPEGYHEQQLPTGAEGRQSGRQNR